jgi:aspartate aminotransferase
MIEPGDEVIIPVPYWLSYQRWSSWREGVPVCISTDAATVQSYSHATAAIDYATNPVVHPSTLLLTPRVWSIPPKSSAIAQVVVEQDIWVVSDEIYEKILYMVLRHLSIGSLGAEILHEHCE